MLRIEFHCHTFYSDDSLTSPEQLLEACRRRRIDRVVITDHNTTDGARLAQELDPVRVIIGEEIMTRHGELLAAYVKEYVPPGLSPLETIERLREQGAFISVSHPFDRLRKGHWEVPQLLRIIPLIDAIEVFNARCLWPSYNREAIDFAYQHHLLGTVGSDAHTAGELGKASLLLPEFQDAAGLRLALTEAQQRCTLSAPWVHLASRYAAYRKKIEREKNEA